DWGAEALTDAQLAYAASDVLHLHALKEKLDAILVREGRADLAAACFRFLPDRVRLDLAGWAAAGIFARSHIFRRAEPDGLGNLSALSPSISLLFRLRLRPWS